MTSRKYAVGTIGAIALGLVAATPATAEMTVSLGGRIQVDATYYDDDNIININGRLQPRDEAGISPFDSAVQGGDAVWEGLRVYRGRIAALDAHLQRLQNSAKALAFDGVPSSSEIRDAVFRTLEANGMRDETHIRLTLSRGEKVTSGMNPRLNRSGCTLIVLAEWKPPVYPDEGIRVITASTRRNTPQCLDSKIHHNNLLNNILAAIEANVAGVDSAIMLDIQGFVSETNDTNLFIVKNGEVLTPHADSCLPGLTRQMVLDICAGNGIRVCERNLSLTELYTADEVFTSGTMGELTPVLEADGPRLQLGCLHAPAKRRQQVQRVPDQPECPLCGSTRVAALNPWADEVVDPAALQRYDLTLEDLADAVAANNGVAGGAYVAAPAGRGGRVFAEDAAQHPYPEREVGECDRREGEDTAAIERTFTPEFRNRLDAVISFAPLGKETILSVVEKFVLQLEAQLMDRGVSIELTKPAAEWLADKGYDPELGARPLRRAIQRRLEDALSERVLLGEFKAGTTIVVDVDTESDELVFEEVEAPDQPPVEMADSACSSACKPSPSVSHNAQSATSVSVGSSGNEGDAHAEPVFENTYPSIGPPDATTLPPNTPPPSPPPSMPNPSTNWKRNQIPKLTAPMHARTPPPASQ